MEARLDPRVGVRADYIRFVGHGKDFAFYSSEIRSEMLYKSILY